MDIKVTELAKDDLEDLPNPVEETLRNKIYSAEKNLNIGASPEQALDKYLSGNMHPALQMNLGRDYRAWFVEGKYVESLEEDTVYCISVLSKKDAQEMIDAIPDFITFLESALQR